MDTNTVLQVLSVLIEIIVAIAGVRLATKGKKVYGWFISLTFALYVVFDLSRLELLPKSEAVISPLFLIASLSILYSVWLIGCEVIPSRRYDL
ncbi:MAG: hypothetical protein OS112_02015 [Methanoregula sp.]|nr:MAG: hypothetical protein OS112_02015 [Methanoregula sp.]